MASQAAIAYEIARKFPPEPSEPLFEVGDIIREYGPAYRANNKLDGSAFVRAPKNFLFPVKALPRIFREKEAGSKGSRGHVYN